MELCKEQSKLAVNKIKETLDVKCNYLRRILNVECITQRAHLMKKNINEDCIK